MIEGCLDWQENGLVRPASVIAATESYFEDQDLMSQWLAEECDAEPGNRYKWEATAKLFEVLDRIRQPCRGEAGKPQDIRHKSDQTGVRALQAWARQDPELQGIEAETETIG